MSKPTTFRTRKRKGKKQVYPITPRQESNFKVKIDKLTGETHNEDYFSPDWSGFAPSNRAYKRNTPILGKRYEVRIDYLLGKKGDYKYEVYLMDKKINMSGTVESFKTRAAAENFIEKSLKPELRQRIKTDKQESWRRKQITDSRAKERQRKAKLLGI